MSAVRRAMWCLGAPVRALLIGAILVYRATLSGWLGGQCRFYPSCSHYAEEAIRVHGAVRGSVMAGWRVLRCNPFGKGGVERVPPPRQAENATPATGWAAYENIILLARPVDSAGPVHEVGRGGR